MNAVFETTIHVFKSNISRYLAWLRDGRYTSIVICRQREPVALVVPISKDKRAGIRLELDANRNRNVDRPGDKIFCAGPGPVMEGEA